MAKTRTNAGAGSRNGKTRRRRSTSNSTRIRLSKPSARNQRRQIGNNARAIARNTRFIQRQRVFTDWHYANDFGLNDKEWNIAQLNDYSKWSPCLRTNPEATDGGHTFVKRMQINCRVAIGSADQVILNFFILRTRYGASNVDLELDQPQDTVDYITHAAGNLFEGTQIRLNSGKFKVMASKYITLQKNAYGYNSVPTDTVGNPNTTWRKFQVNMNCNIPVSCMSSYSSTVIDKISWQNVPFMQQPYYHRYYLCCYPMVAGPETGPKIGAFGFDMQAVCVNTS